MKDEMKLLNNRIDTILDMLQRVLTRQVAMQEMLTTLVEKLDEEFFWDADDDEENILRGRTFREANMEDN